MTHPGPELAEYVDSTLTPSQTARIDEHLRTCATCRAEVRLAIAAREALAATPSPAPPAGLADAAIAEAQELAAARTREGSAPRDLASHRPRPSTPRWLAIAGAAAVIALVALIVPKLGQPGTSPASFAAGASDAARPAASAVEVQHVDYGANFLPEFAAAYDSVAGANVGAPAPDAGEAASPGPISTVAGQGEAVKLVPERLPAATRCLDRAYDNQGGTLTRVILARYAEQPAYLGVYLQSPGAGLEPNVVLVVVASVQGCDLLATGQFRLR
jgi:anti-sigma factor RsiW